MDFRIITPAIYWTLIILWTFVFVFYAQRLFRKNTTDKFFRLLLIILAIDAFRTLFESMYFGAWYTSLTEIIPLYVYEFLAQPKIVFFPKLINLIASLLILFMIIRKWLPEETNRIEILNKLLSEKTKEIEASNVILRSEAQMARENEEKYRKATTNSPFPIMIYAEDGEVILINKTWAKITGYALEEINTIGKWTEKAYGKKSTSQKEYIDKLYLLGESVEEGEFTIITKTGEERIWDFSSAPLDYHEDGRRMVISSAVDVTEKKKTANDLAESNEYNRALFEQTEIGLALTSMDGKLVDVNAAFAAIMGYTIEEVLPLSYWDITPEKYTEQEETQLELLNTNNRYGPYEKEYIHKDGHLVPVRLQGKLITRKGINYIWSSVEDITLRKLTAEALYQSEERYMGLLLNLETGIVVHAPDTSIVSNNERASELLGLNSEQMLGKVVIDPSWKFFNEDQIPLSIEDYPVNKIITHKKSISNQVLGIYRPNSNDLIWVSVNGFPKFNSTGQIMEVVISFIDITDRKIAEEKIIQLNKELENKVLIRTSELEKKGRDLVDSQNALLNIVEDLNEKSEQLQQNAAALEAVNRELESFSYSVSHDLRAPLRGIDGFSLALLEDYSDLLDEQGKNYLSRVRKGTQKMALLIDEMLNLSRLGRLELKPIEINLSMIAHSICNDLSATDSQRKVEFFIEPGLMVMADPTLIRAVMQNLLENAWKFTSKKDFAKIEFGILDFEGKKNYFVRDNGAGFNMEYINKLYSPFQRLHQESEFPGTGIGLTTVQRIIHRHQGTVWAESMVDQGAVFYFTLGI